MNTSEPQFEARDFHKNQILSISTRSRCDWKKLSTLYYQFRLNSYFNTISCDVQSTHTPEARKCVIMFILMTKIFVKWSRDLLIHCVKNGHVLPTGQRYAQPKIVSKISRKCLKVVQGGRAWQPFVGGKNGHEYFRQARIYILQCSRQIHRFCA